MNQMMRYDPYDQILCHHGILGMKWGIRRYQNKDGTLTADGRKRYLNKDETLTEAGKKRFLTDTGKLTTAGKKLYQSKDGNTLNEIKQASVRSKKIFEMTDEELKNETKRMRSENEYKKELETYKKSKAPSKTAVMKKVLSSLNTILNSAKKSEIESAKRADLKKAMDDFSKKNADEQKTTNDQLIKQNVFQQNYVKVRDARGFDAGKNSVLKTLAIAGGVVTTGLTALEIAEAISSMRKK